MAGSTPTPRDVLGQVTNLWARLGARGRLTVGVGMAVAVFSMVLMFARTHTERHAVLYAGLEPRDAAAAVAALDAAKVRYELSGGGTVIEVAADEVDRARLLLAEQNLPRGGNVGYELFQEQNFGLTDFAQRVNYRRALQGELERTISSLDPIASARVHVTQPDRRFFEEKAEASASVTVDLIPGRRLSDRQVAAIRHLVGAAVEGLNPEDVTIVDTAGTLLSRGDQDGASAAALDHKRELETDMERRLTRLLERTVGVGRAQVNVSADIDFSKTDTTEETYDPEQIAVRSEATEEVYEGNGARRPQGLAGAPANEPGANTAGSSASGNAATRLVKSKNYEVNRTVVQTKGANAVVKRLTVAALVDGTYTPAEDDSPPVFTPRPAAELSELQAVLENAAGINTTRGDRIKLSSVEFRDKPDLDPESWSPAAKLPPWLPYAIAAGTVLILGLAWMVLGRKRRPEPITPEILSFPSTVENAQRAIAQAERGQTGMAAGAAPPAALTDGVSPRQRALDMAVEDPERAADVIRGWMAQDAAE